MGWHNKEVQMPGVQNLRSEAYLPVRCNDSACEIKPKMNLPLRNQILAPCLQWGVPDLTGGGEAQPRR